jgi:hypothetical protein
MHELEDQLLYVVSARMDMGWGAFTEALGSLHMRSKRMGVDAATPEHLSDVRRMALTTLDLLGHISSRFDSAGSRIYAEKPLLARLPVGGLARAVLCGARSPATVSDVRAALAPGATVSAGKQPGNRKWAPTRIELSAASVEELRATAETLQVRWRSRPAAWDFLDKAAAVSDYGNALSWVSEPQLNWELREFNPFRLRFEARDQSTGSPRLVSQRNPTTGMWMHRVWRNDGSSATVDRTWGRWLVLDAQERHVLAYDARAGRLMVPTNMSLPRLIGRALALCSGLAPSRVDEAAEGHGIDGYLAYDWVSRSVADRVASLLGQQLNVSSPI